VRARARARGGGMQEREDERIRKGR